MGVTFHFDEAVHTGYAGEGAVCQVEVADNHGVPEVRLGPEGEAHEGYIAHFTDWAQFERFAEAVDSLYHRLKGLHEK